jgi:hypothetical protein
MPLASGWSLGELENPFDPLQLKRCILLANMDESQEAMVHFSI